MLCRVRQILARQAELRAKFLAAADCLRFAARDAGLPGSQLAAGAGRQGQPAQKPPGPGQGQGEGGQPAAAEQGAPASGEGPLAEAPLAFLPHGDAPTTHAAAAKGTLNGSLRAHSTQAGSGAATVAGSAAGGSGGGASVAAPEASGATAATFAAAAGPGNRSGGGLQAGGEAAAVAGQSIQIFCTQLVLNPGSGPVTVPGLPAYIPAPGEPTASSRREPQPRCQRSGCASRSASLHFCQVCVLPASLPRGPRPFAAGPAAWSGVPVAVPSPGPAGHPVDAQRASYVRPLHSPYGGGSYGAPYGGPYSPYPPAVAVQPSSTAAWLPHRPPLAPGSQAGDAERPDSPTASQRPEPPAAPDEGARASRAGSQAGDGHGGHEAVEEFEAFRPSDAGGSPPSASPSRTALCAPGAISRVVSRTHSAAPRPEALEGAGLARLGPELSAAAAAAARPSSRASAAPSGDAESVSEEAAEGEGAAGTRRGGAGGSAAGSGAGQASEAALSAHGAASGRGRSASGGGSRGGSADGGSAGGGDGDSGSVEESGEAGLVTLPLPPGPDGAQKAAMAAELSRLILQAFQVLALAHVRWYGPAACMQSCEPACDLMTGFLTTRQHRRRAA